jgi:polar amino acid transport system permease protein
VSNLEMTVESSKGRSRLLPWDDWASVPWWGLILLLAGLAVAYLIFTNYKYREAFDIFVFGRPERTVALEGLLLTIQITLLSYGAALVLGLLTGLARVGKNPITYTLATLYVEIGRGTPFVVLMLYTAFVLTPLLVNLVVWIGNLLGIAPLAELSIRDVNLTTRAIVALSIGYGAYESEVFRAGIQSIERGQMEAARSLGMSYFQAMRWIILPQAIRRVLPPLGNDFIACLKDSSLATVLAVPELTQLSRIERSRTFRVFEVFNTLAYMYLVMTISLSLLMRVIERRLATE